MTINADFPHVTLIAPQSEILTHNWENDIKNGKMFNSVDASKKEKEKRHKIEHINYFFQLAPLTLINNNNC